MPSLLKLDENNSQQLTYEELIEELHYDPFTGIFTWIKPKQGRRLNKLAGHLHDTGYITIHVKNKNYFAHRLAFLYVNKCFPSNSIDHIDGNRSNNKFSNLRDCRHKENLWNALRGKNNSSGIKGLNYQEETNTFLTAIMCDGEVYSASFSVKKYRTKELAEYMAKCWLGSIREYLHGIYSNDGEGN